MGFEPLCKKYGVKIAIENMDYSFTYPDLLNELLRRMNSPWFGVVLDIGHAWGKGNIQPGEFVRQLDPGILLGLHIQDTQNGNDAHMVPFMGDIDFTDLNMALKEYCYEGDYALEVPSFIMLYSKYGLIKSAFDFSAAIGRKLVNDLDS